MKVEEQGRRKEGSEGKRGGKEEEMEEYGRGGYIGGEDGGRGQERKERLKVGEQERRKERSEGKRGEKEK